MSSFPDRGIIMIQSYIHKNYKKLSFRVLKNLVKFGRIKNTNYYEG